MNSATEIAQEWDTADLPHGAAMADLHRLEMGIHQLFERQVDKSPHALAAVCGERTLTYEQLNSRANQLARHLRSIAVGQGSCVAVMMDRTLHCLVALLGVIKAGAAYVPIDLSLPRKRVAYILGDSGVSHVLADGSARSRLETLDTPVRHVIDVENSNLYSGETGNLDLPFHADREAYCIYTSGSTGTPKGVMVHHRGLVNYVCWAQKQYVGADRRNFAFYSPLSFDLTITSIFVPLICGSCIQVYPEPADETPSLFKVVEDNRADVVKLTPSHLALLKNVSLEGSTLKVLILGGEDLRTETARAIHDKLGGRAVIYNEYGPTETVVGCMIYRYDPSRDVQGSVPIGLAIDNMQIHLLDESLKLVTAGEVGEICISGAGVALGYRNKPEASAQAFRRNPLDPASVLYTSGDLGRVNAEGMLLFLGRKDFQIKLRGYRIELGEIESALLVHPQIRDCTVVTSRRAARADDQGGKVIFCRQCGMASNVPNTTYSADGRCSYCAAFEKYKPAIDGYFSSMDELQSIVESIKAERRSRYDCIVALSGGKDSTYVLCRMADMGLRVLAFTLDNGYISDHAKANIDRVVKRLGVDHRYLSTPHMKEIFVDSLRRHSNVCNGCFKTIYTLAINLAREVQVDHIVMGLSKGQLFETRMSELFRGCTFDKEVFEHNLVEARKIYHRIDDAANRLLDTRHVTDPQVIESIRFIDFYRYCHVSQAQMYQYIQERLGWVRPEDTGRSTNCLINDVGIYVHNQERKYHNYSVPYSWDVRMGHVELQQALRELDDSTEIDVERVQAILKDLGYEVDSSSGSAAEAQLIAYYVSPGEIPADELRELLAQSLPEYMVPSHFVQLDRLPLTPNGKVNREALPRPAGQSLLKPYTPPRNALEGELAELWKSVLSLDQVSVEDNFFDIGGHSLTALMLLYKIDEQFRTTISIQEFSRSPTVGALAQRLQRSSGPLAS